MQSDFARHCADLQAHSRADDIDVNALTIGQLPGTTLISYLINDNRSRGQIACDSGMSPIAVSRVLKRKLAFPDCVLYVVFRYIGYFLCKQHAMPLILLSKPIATLYSTDSSTLTIPI